MELQLIRNATLKINYAGSTFLIDPYFAEAGTQPSFAGKAKNPTVPLPMSTEEILKGVDYVLISHLHPDHFDEAAQAIIPKDLPIYCQPEDSETIRAAGFHAVHPIEDQVDIGGIRLSKTQGQHGTGSILPLMGEVSGFVLSHKNEKTFYWCGDTIWYEGVKENIDWYQPEVIVCHAGANKFFQAHNVFGPAFTGDSEVLIMDAAQVSDLCHHAPESQVVVTHVGALDHETVTRAELRAALKKNIGSGQLFIPEDGQSLVFDQH